MREHGIVTDQCDWRVHVAPLACKLFVFRPSEAVKVLHLGKRVNGFQNGVQGATSIGVLLPPQTLPGLFKIDLDSNYGYSTEWSTSEKGCWATAVTITHLGGTFVQELELQYKGVDVVGSRIGSLEVKCDERASFAKGLPHPRCSGNLFLQLAERNPLRRF